LTSSSLTEKNINFFGKKIPIKYIDQSISQYKARLLIALTLRNSKPFLSKKKADPLIIIPIIPKNDNKKNVQIAEKCALIDQYRKS